MPDVQPIVKAPKRKGSRQARARARRDRDYLAWRDEQLEARPWCEIGPVLATIGHPEVCRRRSALIHHRRLTGQGGAWTLRANTLASCQPCHLHVHHQVDEARAAHLIVASDDDEWAELGEAA